MSTIGSRSSTRRIGRREIQGVSIPDTCSVIKEPPEGSKLSLRVSSNLLYGVSVLFRQKTEYLSNDTSAMRQRLQRDLGSFKGSSKLLLAPPVIQALPLLNAPLFHTMDSTKTHERGQILYTNDPLFSIEDGLLPPIDHLDFLNADLQDQKIVQDTNISTKRKELIRKHDLANNTISHVMSHMTTSEVEDSDIFSAQHHSGILQDDLDSGLEPQFAFNDDGMLLDLGGEETSATFGPAAGGTSFQDFEGGGDDFGFITDNFNDNRQNTGDKRSRSGSVRPDLEKVLEEVGDIPLMKQNTEGTSPKEPTRKECRKRKANSGTSMVIFDDPISHGVDRLRDFRENYLSIMRSKKKPKNTPTTTRKRLDGLLAQDSFFHPVTSLLFQSSPSIDVPIEQPRGRRTNRGDPDDDDEDFVAGLLRRRRSSSIERGRNASTSRRDSRVSISGIPLHFDENTGGDTGGGDVFDYDFANILDGEGHSTSIAGAIAGTSTSSHSKKKSGTPSMGPLPENLEMQDWAFDDCGIQRDHILTLEQVSHATRATVLGSDLSMEADKISVTKKSVKTTSRFLAFIEYRFEDEGGKREELSFKELLGDDYFGEVYGGPWDMEEAKRRTTVVGSFYSVLQLATNAQIEVVQRKATNKLEVGAANDFSIRLTH